MKLLSDKEATAYLGYAPKSNILAQMRMETNKGRWEFVPRHIIFNGQIRYPKEWLDADLKKYIESKNS